ncbi:MAG: 50S ribosomal protein L29 [Rickettsiales bacterium]|jgi:large subunit ribosomal protein L29|nr:50S ribosomal protein L29 [Rickettsiales bacterium]
MAEKKTVKKEIKAAKVDNSTLNAEALQSRLRDLKKDAMNQRFQHTAGQLPKTHVIRKTRRDIARVKTAINAGNK